MSAGPERVAVVGMAGRFPRAQGVEELWRNLRDGVEAVRFFSDEELAAAGVPAALREDPAYVRGCMFLDDADRFDAAFFDVNPREAELTDPQQRIFLECAWEALESAAIDPERYPGQIAVFAGSGRNNYVLDNILANRRVMSSMGVVAAALQNEKDFLATRVAYKLDLKGAAVTVQTACSTSLVALHLGSQALLSGECDAVLAGGVCVAALRKEGYLYVDGGIFSRDGHLRAFDAGASGQVGGNGCAIVVLKRLEDALAEGDTIHAVIRGSALGNDGIRKVSFSAPGVDGQARVISEALAVAGVHPDEIDYVECHGTGTQLGDPIEVSALTQAFRQRTERRGFCPIGSLKTNVGHLDAAAGVAGLIKTALSMRHEALPPSLNFERPNPEIDFESSPFFVNTELRPWKRGARPRIAGVSSFGMGGTNAHVVIEEPPPAPPPSPSAGLELLPLSARSKPALDAAAERLSRHLEEEPATSLADVAHTLQVGRKAFELRRVVLAETREQALAGLAGRDARRVREGRAPKGGRALAFCFSGQGSQYAGMTRGLYEAEQVFRSALDRTCALLARHLAGGLDLRGLLFPAEDERARADEALRRTELTQPALFAVELALARQLEAFGLGADAMIGHSIGEYVAAHLAGVLSLEDACRLVAARGRLIGSLPEGGAMLAVHLAEHELRPRLQGALALAAVNAPELCVVSGPEADVAELEAALAGEALSTRRLHTSHAFHSPLMDPILDAFEAEVRATPLAAPGRRFVSCVSGTWITAAEATDPGYWVRHLRQPVRFADGVRTLVADRERALVEVGPGRSLATLARLSVPAGTPLVASTRHPQEEADDRAVLLGAVAELWACGVPVDWEALRPGQHRRRIPLPGYAFQRERFWVEPDPPETRAAAGARERKADMAEWFYAPAWRSSPNVGPTREALRWLVLADAGDQGVAAALAARLAEEGREVVLVERGGGFAARGEGRFVLDPRNPADYADLFEELAERGFAPDTIAHLWTLDAPPRGELRDGAEGEQTLARLERELDTGFYSLVFLAQALAGHAHGELRLGVVTRAAREVLGGELARPEAATVLGAAKAIDCEQAGVGCTALDLDGADPAACAAWIVAELSRAERAPEVAVRGATRWTPDFAPAPLPAPPPDAPLVRPGAVVLVTGGLGGIGLALAGWLAGEGARLVLVGRSPLPPEDERDAWLAEHDAADATSRKLAAVRALEAAGAEVLALSADVADLDAMRAVLARTRERFGAAPTGVVHAAGLAGAGLIELKTRAAARKVLAPKVRGTQVLETLLAGERLDFFACCSSLASAIVGVGQADYFAANAYLDAWATRARRRGLCAVAIGWDAWREVGMAAETAVPEALRAEREENLRTGISPEEGQRAFARVLAAELPHVFVSTRDLFARAEEIAAEVHGSAAPASAAGAAPGAAPLAAAPAPAATGLHQRPALATPWAAPRGATEEALALVWGDLLGIAGVGRDDDVFDLGGNSLLLMQLSVRIRSDFGVSLPLRALFELKTVAALAERVDTLRMAAEASRGGGAGDEDAEEVTL